MRASPNRPRSRDLRRAFGGWRGLACAALGVALLSACANPFIPPAGSPTAGRTIERQNKPSPYVVGNYCGYGTRKGDLSERPMNRLDAACLEHDACFIERRNRCACNDALVRAADAIARDPRTAPEVRREARVIRNFFPLVRPICLLFPQGIMPPRKQDVLKTRYHAPGGRA